MRFHGPDAWSPFARGGFNAYAFCHGDPVNYSDPSGGWAVGRLSALTAVLAGSLSGGAGYLATTVDAPQDQALLGVLSGVLGVVGVAAAANVRFRFLGPKKRLPSVPSGQGAAPVVNTPVLPRQGSVSEFSSIGKHEARLENARARELKRQERMQRRKAPTLKVVPVKLDSGLVDAGPPRMATGMPREAVAGWIQEQNKLKKDIEIRSDRP